MLEQKINWLQQGWECPKCGAVMSPHTDCCVNCRGNKGGYITTITVGDPLDTIYDVGGMENTVDKVQQNIYDTMGTTLVGSKEAPKQFMVAPNGSARDNKGESI